MNDDNDDRNAYDFELVLLFENGVQFLELLRTIVRYTFLKRSNY